MEPINLFAPNAIEELEKVSIEQKQEQLQNLAELAQKDERIANVIIEELKKSNNKKTRKRRRRKLTIKEIIIRESAISRKMQENRAKKGGEQ